MAKNWNCKKVGSYLNRRGLRARCPLPFLRRSMVPITDRRPNGGAHGAGDLLRPCITGTVDQEPPLRNEYLAAENQSREPNLTSAEALGCRASEARNVTWRDAVPWGTVVISCMIETRNTPFPGHDSVRSVALAPPARCPNLNAYAERWVRSVKEECLSKVVLFGERSLRRALTQYVEHFHAERNHQGKGNVLLFPRDTDVRRKSPCNAASDWAGSCAIIIKRRRIARPKFNP